MPAELISLPPGVVLDPFWDAAPMGIALPIWLVVLIIFLFLLVGPNMWWLYKFLVMRPVQGHGIAARAGNEKTQQVLMFGLNRAFSIQALEYLEKVLSFKDKTRVARWLQTSPYAVGMLGYKSIMLVSEIFDHPKDPVAEMAIVTASRNHNLLLSKKQGKPDLTNAFDENGESLIDLTDAIIDYNSFRDHRSALETENPGGVAIPIYGLYDPGIIYPYTPQNRTAGQFGGTCLKDAGDLNMSQPVKTTWEKAVPVFICLIFGIIAIALTYMYVTQGHPAPTLPPSPIPIPGVAPTPTAVP